MLMIQPYNSSSSSVSPFALSLTPKISTVESIKALTLTIHVKMKMKSLWSYNIDVALNYNTCLPNRQTPNQITPTTRFEAAAAEAASYDSNVWPQNLGNVRGGVVLDFESSVVRLPSAEEESGDFGRRKRDCNVKPVASGDRVYPNFPWPYNCSDPFEASIRTQTHNHLEPSYVDQISSFELGHNGVRVVLDFESSAVLLPSTNGWMQPMSLCNDTRSCDIMLYVRLHVQLPVMIHLKKQKLLAPILRIITGCV
nr:hypothetical protein [Tanacetum cinerariifolium]